MEGEQAMSSFSEGARQIKLVDAQILRHLASIQELKSQQNVHAPISYLPTEILCKIFLYVRSFQEERSGIWSDIIFYQPDLKWITISHVSRHWRTVALNESRLWTNPPLNNPRWNKIMLQRSRSATLPAIILDNDSDHPNCVSSIVLHLPRIKSFTICITQPESLRQLFSRLTHASPELEELSINSMKKKTERTGVDLLDKSERIITEAVELPGHLFGESRLRRLQLAGMIVDWKSRLLSSSLEDLTLTRIPVGSRPSRAEFETLLRSLVHLKRLTLVDACASIIPTGPPQMTPSVSLQLLESLIIDATIPEQMHFFETFSIPAITQAYIAVKYEGLTADAFAPLSHLLMASHLSRFIGCNSDVRRLALIDGYGETLQISPVILDDADRRLHPYSRCVRNSLVIKIDTPSEHRSRLSFQVISIIATSFYAGGLSELDITHMYYINPGALLSIFGDVPRLQVIITRTARALVEALSHDGHTSFSELAPASGAIMFAKLQHIAFIEADFGKRRYQLSVRALRKCLELRRRLGVPIHSIELESCDGLSQETFDVLAKSKEAEHVAWSYNSDSDNDNFYPSCDWLG